MPAVTANTRLRLRVKATAETIVRGGHPWVFADSLRDQNREGQTGELAVIYDRNDKFLAVGLFDADSPIRVRILHAGKPQTIDAAWWQARLSQTRARRAGLFDAQTTGYRLIHGESDGWPGLVLDRYDTTLALKLYTAAWLPRMDETLALIKAQIPSERIVLRLSRNLQAAAAKDFQQHDGQILFGAPPEGAVIFCENGVRFEADVIRGQKTGFFLDQRENRREVETLAAGRRVLNAFSFSGGFSVYAARGGAKSVTDLDISAHALESAKRNFALNGLDPAAHDFIYGDTFDWLKRLARKQRLFDVVILDPPTFSQSKEGGVFRAEKDYGRLVRAALPVLRPGGVLFASTNAAEWKPEDFLADVERAILAAGRKIVQRHYVSQPPDFPVSRAEPAYLKTVWMRVAG